MQLEGVRIVSDWLSGTTAGSSAFSVNAQIPSVPRDAGDIQPPNVTIYDSTRQPWAARREIPNDSAITVPAIIVCEVNQAQVDGEIKQAYRDGKFQIAVLYVIEKADTALGLRHALYTKRAILRSLAQLHSDAGIDARIRNDVVLYECYEIVLSPGLGLWTAHNDAWLTTGVALSYTLRDLAPNAL